LGPRSAQMERCVLVKEQGAWWIAAYHNVWQAALATRAAMTLENPATGAG